MWVVEGGGGADVLHHEGGWGRWGYGWVMAVHNSLVCDVLWPTWSLYTMLHRTTKLHVAPRTHYSVECVYASWTM